jgi:DNA-binding NarL/FixJ family response regulator
VAGTKRVVIADDHPLVHQAIAQCLEETDDFEVVGSATSGAQVAPLVARTAPDLVLLDLNMPVIDGLHCLSVLREKHPQVAVIMFSGVEDPELVEQSLSAGAVAFVAKSINPIDLPSVFRQALEGHVHYSTPRVDPAAVARLQRESAHRNVRESTGLTERELEILGVVARGLSNRAVGKELFLSDQTVKFHLHNIYGKLRVANRTEATAEAHRLGLVDSLSAAS